jgi:hypothetical protein
MNQFSRILIATLAMFLSVESVNAQFEIVSFTIDGGGAISGGSFTLHSAIGQPDAQASLSGGTFSLTGGYIAADTEIVLGDVNGDGSVNLLDISPFVDAISNGTFIPEADINQDGSVNLLDVADFVVLLSGG